MTESLPFEILCGKPDAQIDIVFVHGLSGNPIATWSFDDSGNTCWPKWLCEDFPEARISLIGYPASIFGKAFEKEMNIYERATNVLETLVSNGIGNSPTIFVTHSLGGLVTKQLLRKARDATDEDWVALAKNTRLVVFLGTPHSGSSLASAAKFLAPRATSNHISLLSNQSGELDELNESYRNFAPQIGIKTVAYFEKYKSKGVVIVDKNSADPGVANTTPIGIDANHEFICKPDTRNHIIYRSIVRHTKKVVKNSKPALDVLIGGNGAFAPADYAEKYTTDRRDLLTKLIDANRSHEYPKANEAQNRFAQNYYRLGLHSGARDRNNEILAEVEQRFNLHVYQPKICKKASDQEITAAIQEFVIDGICNKPREFGKISSSTVLEALYFLTEQCHISWDSN